MRIHQNRAMSWAMGLAFAAALPSAHALQGTVVATGLSAPLYLTAPTGDDRLFIVEKGGAIQLWSQGGLQATPYLDLSGKVATQGERGLLGLAFDPGFASNGRLYVNYIDAATNDTVVDRYTVNPASNQVDTSSAQRIISIDQAPFANHKGGWMGFRPRDPSKLYIATGDGGDADDPLNNGQRTDTLLGKLLRVDVSGTGAGYTVPTDNPFVGQAGVLPEIWATGLRNPWRNSFDRQTGDLWIADVGQDLREEINLERTGDAGGHNYGWRLREGTAQTPDVGGTAPGLTDPIFDYARMDQPGGLGNSITGGYVYRGPSIADADGRYFFSDFISSRVFSFLLDAQGHPVDLREDTGALLGDTGLSNVSSFGEDGHGGLYAIGYNGTVVRLVPEPSSGVLLLAGLGGLLALQRARRRENSGESGRNSAR
jgi:glucose/arabinose dehydrogenase